MNRDVTAALRLALQGHLSLRKSRLESFCVLVVGVLLSRTVNLSHLACMFPTRAAIASNGAVAKFWRLPRVEHAGGICASEPEVADDPERPCREAEAPVEGRFQGSALRGDTDPAGRLVVSALSAQLP